MSIRMSLTSNGKPQPSIAVLGIGGGGGNAVRAMVEGGLAGVAFKTANTDAQALEETGAECRIRLGSELTHGYGAGTDPEIGRRAAEESVNEIRDALNGLDMLFVTAGMGGGTGTGASPVVARVARALGILTIGVVTTPFEFEGESRMEVAKLGIGNLLEHVDTLLVVANQNIFHLEDGVPHLLVAFDSVNRILHDAVRGVVDLVTRPGMINTDFADLVMALRDGGLGVIGEGIASGSDRARQAAMLAAANPLLDGLTLEGAARLLINVTGGRDLNPDDFDTAIGYLSNLASPDVQMKVGASFDPELEGSVRVYIAASGVEQVRKTSAIRRRPAATEEHGGVREIHVARPAGSADGKDAEVAPTPGRERAREGGQPFIPPMAELSAGLDSAADEDAEIALQAAADEDDWDDGIELDTRSHGGAGSTVAVSPTLSGNLQAAPGRGAGPERRPAAPGGSSPATGRSAPAEPARSRRAAPHLTPGRTVPGGRSQGAPGAPGAQTGRAPGAGVRRPVPPAPGQNPDPGQPGGRSRRKPVGVSFSGSTGGPAIGELRERLKRPREASRPPRATPAPQPARTPQAATRPPRPPAAPQPPARPEPGPKSRSRRDFGIRAGVPNLPRQTAAEAEQKLREEREEAERRTRGVTRRSPGLLSRLLSSKE